MHSLGWKARAQALLAAAVLCLLLAPTLTPRQAIAASPTVSLPGGAALPHGTETVAGTGFDPQATVALTLGGSLGTVSAGVTAADGAGDFSIAITLPFTLDAGLTNVITASEIEGPASASASFQGLGVQPSASPGGRIAARPGDSLSLHVLGFAPRDPLSITVGGLPALLPSGMPGFSTDQTGSADLRFMVPAGAQPGLSKVTINGLAAGAGQADVASIPIDVAGPDGLSVAPNPVRAGDPLAIAATGFLSGEALIMTLNYVDSSSKGSALFVASATADQTGNLTASLLIPGSAVPTSTAMLQVRGRTSGMLLSQPLIINGHPAIDVQPPGAGPGVTVSLLGSGFGPGERVFVTTPAFQVPGGSVVADATGQFTATTSVLPLLPPGVYGVGVSGVDGNLSSTQFTVPLRRPASLQVQPATAQPGDLVEISGRGFRAREPVRLSLNGTWLQLPGGDLQASAAGAIEARMRVPRSLAAAGSYALSATGQLTGTAAVSRLDVTLPLVYRTYFAEGDTGDGPTVRFGESLNMLNTGPVTATGQVQYFISEGLTRTVAVAVAPHSSLMESVQRDVGRILAVSALVELDHQVAVTRTMTRITIAGQGLASSVSGGETSASDFWYFAESYTGVTFQEYLSILNPGSVRAVVSVQYLGLPGASMMAPTAVTVPPHQRATLNIRALAPNRSLGLSVTSDQPVAAERVLYWGDGSGSAKYGSSVSSGIRGASTIWTFPYVSASNGDQAYLSFANPTNVNAQVQFSVIGLRRNTVALSPFTLRAGVRMTVALPSQGTNGGPVSIVARSDVPIVAEQAQYFGGSPNTGAHTGSVEAGVPSAVQWAFAGSDAVGLNSSVWYVYNPGAADATLSGTLYGVDGKVTTVQRVAPAGKLSRIDGTLDPAGMASGGMLWTSTVPVSMAQVWQGANDALGAVLGGLAGAALGR